MRALTASRRRLMVYAALAATLLAPGRQARAWVYPEHRQISLLAVQSLDPQRRAVLDGLWAAARLGHEQRLCASAIEAGQATAPSCLDWAAWPAISGDHSCSAAEMLSTVLESRWILGVADVAARLGQHLANPKKGQWRINVLRTSDIQLQRADPEYATRATSNNAHFLLARPAPETTGKEYLELSLSPGTLANAVGAYAFYHSAALEKARRLSTWPAGVDGARRAELARAVLADEAFALHFIEDTFAAGHVAGTWGSTAVRKGTHDYYNEHGLAAQTWAGKLLVLGGDANMRPEDARRAADTARTSIDQLLDAAAPRGDAASPVPAGPPPAPEALDTCSAGALAAPRVPPPATMMPLWIEVLRTTPAPKLAEGLGALPRFRAELGLFIGVSASAELNYLSGGFITTESSGAMGAIAVGVRVGLGIEGVMDESGDGLTFVDVALRQSTPSTMPFTDDPAVADAGAFSSAIPARAGLALRVRAPFWLIPGDLLLGALLVAPLSPRMYEKMAVTAVNGGLIPWQGGMTTPVGRFQLVLGRELGVVLYGYGIGQTRILVPGTVAGVPAPTLVALRSIALDFPIFEYRPFRAFSLDQSSMLVFQLYGGFEMPGSAEVIAPAGAPFPELQTIFDFGIRIAFDWRRY